MIPYHGYDYAAYNAAAAAAAAAHYADPSAVAAHHAGLVASPPQGPRIFFKIPRVVPKQRERFETEELFKRNARDQEVRERQYPEPRFNGQSMVYAWRWRRLSPFFPVPAISTISTESHGLHVSTKYVDTPIPIFNLLSCARDLVAALINSQSIKALQKLVIAPREFRCARGKKEERGQNWSKILARPSLAVGEEG